MLTHTGFPPEVAVWCSLVLVDYLCTLVSNEVAPLPSPRICRGGDAVPQSHTDAVP